jgi:hypothetical protein
VILPERERKREGEGGGERESAREKEREGEGEGEGEGERVNLSVQVLNDVNECSWSAGFIASGINDQAETESSNLIGVSSFYSTSNVIRIFSLIKI